MCPLVGLTREALRPLIETCQFNWNLPKDSDQIFRLCMISLMVIMITKSLSKPFLMFKKVIHLSKTLSLGVIPTLSWVEPTIRIIIKICLRMLSQDKIKLMLNFLKYLKNKKDACLARCMRSRSVIQRSDFSRRVNFYPRKFLPNSKSIHCHQLHCSLATPS